MITPILGQNERLAKWVASQPPFDCSRDFGQCTAIGWALDDNLLAATVYSNYDPQGGVIELSTAAVHPQWLTRGTINMMFSYPFDQLGCQMVVLRVSEHNTRMRAIAQRFGFVEFVIPRLRGRDEAECVYTLTAEQWQSSPFRR